jgi:alpha-L-fucosidase
VQKGGKVYAFVMAWPESGRVTLTALATGSKHAPGQVERVELLTTAQWTGTPGTANLTFERTAEGLTIMLPEERHGDYVYTFEIAGRGLVAG